MGSTEQSKRKIPFKVLKDLFPEANWDVGYLSAENLHRCANHPVKKISLDVVENFSNDIHFNETTNCIVLIRKGHTWDYTIYMEAYSILKLSQLDNLNIKYHIIHTNYKEAAILSGVGVRALNSLIYSYKFGFDHHITAIRFEDEIVDYPTNARINYQIWNRCLGCDDCANACPAQAIHNKGDPMSWWIDGSKCIDFILYNNHPKIPSIKDFWYKNVHPELPQTTVDKMTCAKSTKKVFEEMGWTFDPNNELPWDQNGYTYDTQVVRKDGVAIDVPICRECTSQPRCSKWNGNYPYDEIHTRDQLNIIELALRKE